MPPVAYVGIVAISVAVFLFWGGPLWTSPREASHVARFVVSYLVVVPVAALVLGHLGRLSVDRLVTSVGTAWAIKLLITSLLYQVLARGTASDVHATVPIATTPRALAVVPPYRPASGDFARGTIAGRITSSGAAVAGAWVILERPAPGLSPGEPERVEMPLGKRSGDVVLVRSWDELVAKNHGASLHTVRLSSGVTFASNTSVPGGAEVAIALPEPGIYEVGCVTHPSESGRLIVLDHPYAAMTDADGRFDLDAVPAGESHAAVVTATVTFRRVVSVSPGGRTSMDVDLIEQEPPPG